MSIQIKDGITFDDVLLVPQYSEIETRSSVDLSVFIFKLANNLVQHPIIPSNMKTIIGYDMARTIFLNKGLGILHRFMSLEEQIGIVQKLAAEFGKIVWSHIGFSVGVKKEDYKCVDTLAEAGAKIICIDVAHGHSSLCFGMCDYINITYPDIVLIAGNVATGKGAYDLWEAGADIVKVGIGGGSLCTTRIETGNGVPQLTSLMEAAEAKKAFMAASRSSKNNGDSFSAKHRTYHPLIMSDGGVKNAGDIVKALCFADLVMVGNMFAGCEETPGEVLSIEGRTYKEYVGSSTHKANHIEGVCALVQTKGSFKTVLTKMLEGICSGCSYQGASNLDELKESPSFVRMTTSGLRESHPHDVIVK